MGSSLIAFRVLFLRMPSYLGGLKRDPNLENYPRDVSKVEDIFPQMGLEFQGL